MSSDDHKTRTWVPHIELGTVLAVAALLVSGLSFYRGYLYTKQDLEITVTEVSYVTNQGGVYITIAFSNGGNRDAAVLRVEPALWTGENTPQAAWKALLDKGHPEIPLTSPRTPLVVKSWRGGSRQARRDARSCRRGEQLARVAGRRLPRHSRRDDELGWQSVSAGARRRAADARSRRPDPRRRPGDSPDAARLRRSQGRAAWRQGAVEQKDAVRLGRSALVNDCRAEDNPTDVTHSAYLSWRPAVAPARAGVIVVRSPVTDSTFSRV